MAALRNADAAGDAEAATRIAAMIKNQSQLGFNNLDVPTESNLESQSVAQAKPDPTFSEMLTGGAEALGTLATGATSGALGFAGGSLIGAAGELLGLTDDGEKLATEAAGALTFEPRTEFGRELIADIGELASALPPVMGAVSVGIIPTAKTLQQAGKLQAGKAKRLSKRTIQNLSKTKRALAEEIKAGNRNAGNIAMQLDADGTLIKNPNMKKAIDLMGSNEAAYNLALDFERMSSATKELVNKGLDIIQDNKDIGGRKAAAMNRPIEVVAIPIEKRILTLQGINNKASKKIGELMNSKQGAVPVNVKKPLVDFINNLKEEKIDVYTGDNGSLKVDLSRATSNAKEALSEIQLNNIITELSSGKVTAKQAHGLKRDLRSMVSFDQSAIGASKPNDRITNAIKGFASDISTSIENKIPSYRLANKHMSESFDSLKMADNLLGKKLGLGEEGSTQKLTGVANKIATNYPSRTDAPLLVKALDEALAKRGIRPKDDIIDLVFAMQDIEDVFKLEQAQASRGITGRMTQAGADVAGTAIDVSTGGSAAIARKGLDVATSLFKKMPVTEFNDKMKAIRALSKTKEKTD